MIEVRRGDVIEALADEPDNGFDACFCDPPYGYTFMGKKWDHAVPGPDYWAEVLRVLKPGAMLLAFGGTRTWHRLACAIEDAGFELRDTCMYLYGQGFPKSHAIGKAIDKVAGVEGSYGNYKSKDHAIKRSPGNQRMHEGYQRPWRDNPAIEDRNARQYIAATPEAKVWEGYGTSLKPAWEPILLAMKPLDGTFAANALKWHVAGLNVDGCRIGADRTIERQYDAEPSSGRTGSGRGYFSGDKNIRQDNWLTKGRWPANLILSHTPECVRVGTKRVKGSSRSDRGKEASGIPSVSLSGGVDGSLNKQQAPGYADPDGLEEVEEWRCAEGCSVALLDQQAGIRKSGDLTGQPRSENRIYGKAGATLGRPRYYKGDSGSASRFFFTSKASRREREAGLRGHLPCLECGGIDSEYHLDKKGKKRPCRRNGHPTVKGLSLCEHLARLILPPMEYREEAKLLVPFAGSASEMIGAIHAGWRNVVGIEIVEEYVAIARARLAVVQGGLL